MELEEFKNIFGSSGKGDQSLSPKIIDQMTERKYYVKMKKIAYPEFFGIAVCIAAAIFIGWNFEKFDTSFLKGTGVVSIVTLIALSIISYLSLQPFEDVKNINRTFVVTLKAFTSHTLRFYKLQKLNVLLSYLLMVTMIILLSKLFNGKDVTENKYFWIFSFTFGYIFLQFYSKWVMKYYRNTLKQTEELIKELSA